jgi:hypothetical protein
MLKKTKSVVMDIMLIIAFIQAARGWYYLVKDGVILLKETHARRQK